MRTIKEPKKNIALLWRQPNIKQTVYRPMKFLLRSNTADGILLYNVVTSEMVLLDDDEGRVFESLPAIYNVKMNELIARHFIVPETFDENKSVKQLRALIKKLEPSTRVNGFTILPTTECNARCYYCFESDYDHCTMTEKIAGDVIDYIEKKCKGKPVDITWFGGEPLVAIKRISQICTGLNSKAIQFKSSMVTNGYRFDEEVIRIAKNDWHLTGVQITLDGTESVYNKTKAFVNPKDNPYQRVLRNIGLLLDNGITVVIRLNVSDSNYADLNDLIDELLSKFGGRKGFAGYSHAVYEGVGFEPLTYSDNNYVDTQTVALDTKLKKNGLLGSYARLPYLRVIHCMADNDSTRLIYPDGTIGKCENISATDGIGDIYCDISNEEKKEWYKTIEQPDECTDCCLFPHCFDLKVCPEAGRCSQVKQKWKINSYCILMKEIYFKYKQEVIQPDHDEIMPGECES